MKPVIFSLIDTGIFLEKVPQITRYTGELHGTNINNDAMCIE